MSDPLVPVPSNFGPLVEWAKKIEDAPDAEIPRFYEMVTEIRQSYVDELNPILTACREEIKRRLIEREAKSMPNKEYEVELDPQYTPYYYNTELLRQAAALLPDEESAKVIKRVPEHQVTVPEEWVAGNPRSITALIEKYKGTQVAELLSKGMQRDSLEPRVVIKARKVIKKVTPKPSTSLPLGNPVSGASA